MPLLQTCTHPGCTILTIGVLCIEHEPVRQTRTFPRGRPFPPVEKDLRSQRLTVDALETGAMTAGVSSLSL